MENKIKLKVTGLTEKEADYSNNAKELKEIQRIIAKLDNHDKQITPRAEQAIFSTAVVVFNSAMLICINNQFFESHQFLSARVMISLLLVMAFIIFAVNSYLATPETHEEALHIALKKYSPLAQGEYSRLMAEIHQSNALHLTEIKNWTLQEEKAMSRSADSASSPA